VLIQTSGRGRGCAEVVPLGSAVFKYKCLLQHDFANLAVIDIQPDDGDSTALQARAKAVISGLRSAKGKFGLHDSFRWGVESGARCMASASAIAVAAALSARLWCVKRDEHVGPGLGGGRPATGHRCVLCAPVSAPCAPGRIRGYPARFPLHGSSGTSNRHFLEAQVQKLAAAVFARLPVEAAGDRSRASTAVPLCIPHMLLRGYGEPQN
jgi:hypothetical protein